MRIIEVNRNAWTRYRTLCSTLVRSIRESKDDKELCQSPHYEGQETGPIQTEGNSRIDFVCQEAGGRDSHSYFEDCFIKACKNLSLTAERCNGRIRESVKYEGLQQLMHELALDPLLLPFLSADHQKTSGDQDMISIIT